LIHGAWIFVKEAMYRFNEFSYLFSFIAAGFGSENRSFLKMAPLNHFGNMSMGMKLKRASSPICASAGVRATSRQ
jgi:hypothetical protein